MEHLVYQGITTGTTTTVEQFIDNGDTLYADVNGSNAISTRYVPNVTGSNTWLVRVNASGGGAMLITDHLGSVRVVTSLTGSVLDTINYDAFGNITSETTPANRGELGFQGMWFDTVTGTYQSGPRNYNPQTHEWQSEDPTGVTADPSNLYRFVNNAPTDGTDPTGTHVVVACDNENHQDVFNAIATELSAYHSYAVGDSAPLNIGFKSYWYSHYYWMNNLQPGYKSSIQGYLNQLTPLQENSPNARMQQILKEENSSKMLLIASLANGNKDLQFKSEENSSAFRYLLDPSAFLKDIIDSGKNLVQLYKSVREFANDLGSSGNKLMSALSSHPFDVGGNLVSGVGNGFRTYLGDTPSAFFQRLQSHFLGWLFSRSPGGLEGIEPPKEFSGAELGGFAYNLLVKKSHITDLTPDFFKSVIQDVSGVDFDALGKDIGDIQNGNISSVLLRHGPQFVTPLTQGLTGDLSSALVTPLLTKVGAKILAALPPGVGQVGGIVSILYSGVQFLTNEQNVHDIQGLLHTSSASVAEIVDGVTQGSPAGLGRVSSATDRILVAATSPALSFLATLVGADQIPGQVSSVLSKLDLRSYVYTAAYKLAEGVKGKFGFSTSTAAPLAPKVTMSNGQKLWLIAGPNGKAELVLGDPRRVTDTSTAAEKARGDGNSIEALQMKLAESMKIIANLKQGEKAPQGLQQQIALLQQQILAKQQAAVPDVTAESAQLGPELCNGACFGAGTRMLTPEGSKAIEELQVGDWLLSRSEDDAEGPVEPKRVVTTFVRTAVILEVYVNGQVIRTTTEHPFHVMDRGWIPASALVEGDLLSSHDANLHRVQAIVATQKVVTVYNVQIETHHTYFVGCLEWGFSVWAHNACKEFFELMEKLGISVPGAKDKYFRVRGQLPQEKWEQAFRDYLSKKGLTGATLENAIAVAIKPDSVQTGDRQKPGNRFHYDSLNGADGEYGPSQLQAQYPQTQFEFKRRGQSGVDVKVVGGKHPSSYPGSTWKKGNDYADFKSDTYDGRRHFANEMADGLMPMNTEMLLYDPVTLKLKRVQL